MGKAILEVDVRDQEPIIKEKRLGKTKANQMKG